MGVAVGTEEGQFCDPVIIQWCVIDGFFLSVNYNNKKGFVCDVIDYSRDRSRQRVIQLIVCEA